MPKRQIPSKVRQFCYKRDQNACQELGCESTRQNGGIMQLHHIKPEQFGGLDIPSNLITLCDIHHKNMHAEFSAFYPDSQRVLRRMNFQMQSLLSHIRNMARVDDGLDLKPYLHLLTGQNTFRLGQLEIIRAASKGQDVLFVTPTGSGKSACYQLPGLLSNKPSLVISPLKALMKDQVESIWRKKIPATYINSDLSLKERQNRYHFIVNNMYKFIFVAPERFQSKEPETNSLYSNNYAHLVIDEAHEIEMWGMAFRPAYKSLGDLRQKLSRPPIIALTATASKSTQQHILKALDAQNAKVIVTGFYRPNIKIIINSKFGEELGKFKHVEQIIRNHPNEKILIFTPTLNRGSELLDYLKQKEIDVNFFHSKLDSKDKMRLQNLYTGTEKPELQILISTSAFGMGIDIPNIRHIIHLAPALSLTDYVQQIGRAGRDGQQSYAHLLFDLGDEGLLKFIADKQLKQPGFQQKHSYSDADMAQVKNKLHSQINDMMKLIYQPSGNEWKYIQDYFGETQFSTWQFYGKKTLNLGLIVLLAFLMLSVIIILMQLL